MNSNGIIEQLDYMEREARQYAEELRNGGKHENVTVFRYRSRMNNYAASDHRSLYEYSGYAVRYSTTDVEDARINAGTRATAKFHDRSITLFVNGGGIPMDSVWPHGRAVFDIAGEEIVPMWVAFRSPMEDSGMYNPLRETAGFMRSRPHEGYAVLPDGPLRYWYIVLDEAEAQHANG